MPVGSQSDTPTPRDALCLLRIRYMYRMEDAIQREQLSHRIPAKLPAQLPTQAHDLTQYKQPKYGDKPKQDQRFTFDRGASPHYNGSWICSNCKASNSDLTPDLCPLCGDHR